MYFNPDAQKDLEQVVERSFRPTTEILLDLLKDGLKCAFSISGMVVDQLERWDPGMLDLLTEAATQPGVELLAQTYYHSVAGLFKDQREFRDEILLHRDLMHERFGSTPTLFAHTEYPLTPVTASTLADTGMEAAIIEGNGGVVQESEHNVLFTCQGLPVLITHCELSDDIAVRFPRREWDRWPLMADRFASWVAASPGECVTLFLDYRIFGDTIGKETGIFDFLRALPTAFSDAGVETEHPSAAARLPSRGELIVEEEHARSAGPIGATDGQRTILQQSWRSDLPPDFEPGKPPTRSAVFRRRRHSISPRTTDPSGTPPTACRSWRICWSTFPRALSGTTVSGRISPDGSTRSSATRNWQGRFRRSRHVPRCNPSYRRGLTNYGNA
jgi:alpha-amylase